MSTGREPISPTSAIPVTEAAITGATMRSSPSTKYAAASPAAAPAAQPAMLAATHHRAPGSRVLRTRHRALRDLCPETGRLAQSHRHRERHAGAESDPRCQGPAPGITERLPENALLERSDGQAEPDHEDGEERIPGIPGDREDDDERRECQHHAEGGRAYPPEPDRPPAPPF